MPDERETAPLADEARKLLGLAQEWAKRNIPEHSGPDCQWCPLCQFVGLLRGEHPEVAEHIAEAGNAVAGAIRGLFEAAAKQAEAANAKPRRPRPGPGRSAGSASRVQHIRLVDES
jgi:hypothetical protein